jgi:hypothetical protein
MSRIEADRQSTRQFAPKECAILQRGAVAILGRVAALDKAYGLTARPIGTGDVGWPLLAVDRGCLLAGCASPSKRTCRGLRSTAGRASAGRRGAPGTASTGCNGSAGCVTTTGRSASDLGGRRRRSFAPGRSASVGLPAARDGITRARWYASVRWELEARRSLGTPKQEPCNCYHSTHPTSLPPKGSGHNECPI